MITRLQVDGFKNLVDVDIHFGKFNVVTGPNGIGKSNLFDFIHLWRLHVDQDLRGAIAQNRGGADSLSRAFFRLDSKIRSTISFAIETVDDYDASGHVMGYSGKLSYDSDSQVYLSEQKLTGVALDSLNGMPTALYKLANNDAADRFYQEVKRWRVINLQPKVMREETGYENFGEVQEDGTGIASAVKRLGSDVLQSLSNRLFSLTGEVKEIKVHGGEDGGPVWLTIKDPHGASHNARALSEGTLRFLALAVLWLDPEATGVFCIEEPENGIHPSKLPALLRLLRDISEKPGCQVIVNTHSPALVAQTPAEDIIVAYPVQRADPDGTYYTIPRFAGLKDTWRQEAGMHVATISQVLDFLDPVPQRYSDDPKRLLDRDDARRLVERRRKFTWEETED